MIINIFEFGKDLTKIYNDIINDNDNIKKYIIYIIVILIY